MSITYDKELQDSIKESNNQLIEEQNQLDNAKQAAKLSLYYSHGGTEKNQNNYLSIKKDEAKAHSINKKAVKADNLANNAVTAAKQSLIDAGKATSNVSTAAANMQIAANAITKLSSDVAAILAVANAADYDSKIQWSVESAYKKIKKAAQLAEKVSLISLQTTIEASQSTASTVVTDAVAALASVTNFHKSSAARYDSLANQAVAANEALTDAKKVEKNASASFDISRMKDKAITTTRALINQVSNNNILLFDPVLEAEKSTVNPKLDKGKHHHPGVKVGESYTIKFDRFQNEKDIKSYKVIMAKWDDAEAFDINIAKDLQPGTYLQIPPQGYRGYARTFYLLGTNQAYILDDPKYPVKETVDAHDFQHLDHRGIAVDYQGKPVERGVYYVAFVYAEFTDEFERTTQNVDGILSLPSKDLILQAALPVAPAPKLYEPTFDSRNFAVQFTTPLRAYDPDLYEYRILLVQSDNVQSNETNKRIQKAAEQLYQAEYHYNAESLKLDEWLQALYELEVKYNTYQINIESTTEQLENVEEKIKELEKKKEKVPRSLQAEVKELNKQLDHMKEDIKSNLEQQDDLEYRIYGKAAESDDDKMGGQTKVVEQAKEDYQTAIDDLESISAKKISDFIFDEDLMATVEPANYYVATPILSQWSKKSADETLTQRNEQFKLVETKLGDLIEDKVLVDIKVKKAETDVFNAKEEVQLAITQLQNRESELDDAELKHLKKSKGTSDQSSEDESKKGKDGLEKAIENLKKAQKDVLDKQDNLHEKEITLQQANTLKKQSKASEEALIGNFLKAKKSMAIAERIKKIVASQGPIEEVFKDGDLEIDVIIEHRDKNVVFYTEVGEDATDNYGEPLQMNEHNLLDYAHKIYEGLFAEIEEKIKSGDFDEEKIKKEVGDKTRKYLEELSDEKLTRMIPPKDKSKDISYQAMVYTALKSTNVEDVLVYKPASSPYSDNHHDGSLYQIS